MKILVFWAVIFGLSFIAPENFTTAFMLGSIFGAYWMYWMVN
jgi:hypothetical protein